MTDRYDLLIVGGGTGGYSAAFRARELGLSAAIIERDKLGGTCVHRGCIPTKSLLHTAELLEQTRQAGRFGIHADDARVDFEEVLKAKNEVVASIYQGLWELVKGRQVDLIKGEGRLLAGDEVAVGTEQGVRRLGFKHLVLATGSKPKIPPGVTVDGEVVITSDHALNLESVPRSVIVLGGGYVGVEFASLWRSFGADVTLVEMEPALMGREDAEITAALTRALEGRGIKLMLGSRVESVSRNGQLRVEVATTAGTQVLRAEKMLVAVGRQPVADGLREAGVKIGKQGAVVDSNLQTSRPRVYAVGDLLPTPQLAHAAFAEGIFVAEVISGLNPEPVDYNAVAHCVYSFPEMASVGLTEAAAGEKSQPVKIVRVPFKINSRARIANEDIGETKIVAEEGGRVLGIHMVGAKVTEMISEAMLVIGWDAQADDVARFLHPHPTYSEAIGEASLKLAGKPLHLL
ncbi:MAG: dihydrolipoyl dehydrogenase [Actinomycetota bacterium]|nr:dihydrolipoyl dehydrogenase [Actinomycetota bacterium]